MKESQQSINLRKLNGDYLNLFFSKEVRRAFRKKVPTYKKIKLLVSFLINGQIKEIFIRLVSKNKNISYNKNIGIPFVEDDNREYQGEKKAVVYTAVFGKKTPINQPMYINPHYDYYIFTDQPLPTDSVWKKYDFDKTILPSNLDGAGKNRWFKMHPHLYFQDYEISVYIDGGIILVADVMPWVESLDDRILGTHLLSSKIDCVYESSKTVIRAHKAPKEKVLQQMKKYRNDGYPKHNGMYENGVLVRNHNSHGCISLMNDWWHEMMTFTMRDQLSLGYILWKNKIDKSKILLLGDNIFMNPRIRFWDL